ncbi:MAG: hypothetical protein PHH37_12885 [Paludibacter sp.]|nr:hypothetical protein [Paludibacter sp.]
MAIYIMDVISYKYGIAVSSADDTVARQFRYGSARMANIERTTQTAFLMLGELIRNL